MDPPTTSPAATGISQSYNTDDSQLRAAAAAASAEAESPANGPTPNLAAAVGRKRRASGAPGSRGVANLTPDQLAKKRANDREAQRAIRERTRNTIESLEQRIRELESQQPFQDLQRITQERNRALAEVEELRRRLGAVIGIAGGQQLGLHGTFTLDQLIDLPSLTDKDTELASLTAQQSPLPPASQSPHTYTRRPGPPYEQQHLHPDLRSPQSLTAQPTPPSQVTYPARDGTLRTWSPSVDRSPGPPQHSPTPSGGQNSNTGERLGVKFLVESSHQQQQPSNPLSGSTLSSPRANSLPLYQCLTLHDEASCPLDSLLIDVHASQRKLLRDGASQMDAIGPEYPAFSAMVEPGAHPEPHRISALLIDILSKFPDISKRPEKVAVLYIMFLVMRWLICPCKGCYERLPEWCRPVPEQLERHHMAWSDYLPWPHMRKMIALNERPYKFDDFFVPYCQTLSLNWPLPHDCVLISIPAGSEPTTLLMNPAFEYHLRKLENWSLGNTFQQVFPELVDRSVVIKGS